MNPSEPINPKPAIMMSMEGTYPFHSGGVSTWCHELIRNMPGYNFDLLAIECNPWVKARYRVPANVKSMQMIPQYHGHEYDIISMGRRRYTSNYIRTTMRSVNELLLPGLEKFLVQLMRGCPDPEEFAQTMADLNFYWRSHDYRRSLRTRLVWDAYIRSVAGVSWPCAPSEKDLVLGLSMIQNLFTPLAFQITRVQLAHSTAAAFCSIPAIIAKKKYGARMLLSEHGIYLRERLLDLKRIHHSSFVKNLFHRMVISLVRASYHSADRVLPVCNFNSRWERHLGVAAEKISTVYNGVDPRDFMPSERSATGEGRPTVVTMARIDPLKDIETLLRTAHMVRKEIPDVLFKLYGDVWDDKYYQFCLDLHADLSLDGCFQFAGHTRDPQQAYHEGDLVVLSSVSEGFPFTLVEAMMCCRPVIATSVGGVNEALDGCGLIVEPRNPRMMADSCIHLLGNEKLRRHLARKALSHARSHFTTKIMVDEYTDIYNANLRNIHRFADPESESLKEPALASL